MNKKLNFSLVSVLALLILFTSTQNIKAVDKCALGLIYNQKTADQYCPETCEKAGGAWISHGWLSETGRDCSKIAKDNTIGSICGCTICECEDGKQVKCDESKNALGPHQCKSNCDCSKGRICDNGRCSGAACCADCTSARAACALGCQVLPGTKTWCIWACENTRSNCVDNCGGCTDSKKEIKKEEEKKTPSSSASTPHPEKKGVIEVPPTSKFPLAHETKKSLNHEETLKEKEPSQGKESLNHEESPKPKELPSHEERPSKS